MLGIAEHVSAGRPGQPQTACGRQHAANDGLALVALSMDAPPTRMAAPATGPPSFMGGIGLQGAKILYEDDLTPYPPGWVDIMMAIDAHHG